MTDFNIRITHRAQQGFNPAVTVIELGNASDSGRFTSHIDAFEEAQKVAADLILGASAIEARDGSPYLQWSNTLCDGTRVNHAAAEKACAALGDGWRLPTRAELLSLVDDTRYDPAIDTDRFPDTKSGAYWTSTPLASVPSFAWIVGFGSGFASGCLRSNDYAFVRAVRSVPASQ